MDFIAQVHGSIDYLFLNRPVHDGQAVISSKANVNEKLILLNTIRRDQSSEGHPSSFAMATPAETLPVRNLPYRMTATGNEVGNNKGESITTQNSFHGVHATTAVTQVSAPALNFIKHEYDLTLVLFKYFNQFTKPNCEII